jgi:pimeloyl-ACP methyl ester carboxylesterase
LKPYAILPAFLCVLASGVPAAQSPARDAGGALRTGNACVVLLHGLGRTHLSMRKMASAAEAAGYVTVNVDYSSRAKRIEALAAEAVPQGLQRCREAGAAPVHFVTHSMGGIVVRYFLEKHAVPVLGRVVMLSPPNQGSEAADSLLEDKAYRWINGPAGQQLGTGPDGIAARLGPVDYPVGIIAGNEHSFFDAWLSRRIPGENDGKVSVERAKVAGMSDFLVLAAAHSFIMNDGEAIAQALHFLAHGRFRREGSVPAGAPLN